MKCTTAKPWLTYPQQCLPRRRKPIDARAETLAASPVFRKGLVERPHPYVAGL